MTKWVLVPLCLWAAACGDDDNNGRLPDAPSTPIDAVDPLPVTVTVTLAGQPSANQTVYFQSKDSKTTETKQTDASGNASAIVETGGYVTVIEPDRPLAAIGPFTSLSTFAGVQPGDHLYVDVPGIGGNDDSFTVNVSVPNEEVGNNYRVDTTCGGGELGRGNGQVRAGGKTKAAQLLAEVSNTVTLFKPCTTIDAIAIATDAEGFMVKWAYKSNIAVAQDTQITFDAWTDTVDTTFEYSFVSGTRADFNRAFYTPRGHLFTIFDNAFAETEDSAGTRTLRLPNPNGVSALTRSNDNPYSGAGENRVIEWGANANYTLDFKTVALNNFQSSAQLDVPGHKVTWDEATDGKVPDFALAIYDINRADGETSNNWSWRIMAPYTAGTVTYPVLPTTLFDFNPKDGDSLGNAEVLTVHNPGGYNAARNAHVFRGEDNFYDLETGMAGAAGQIVYQRYFVGELTRSASKPATARKATPIKAKAVHRAPARTAR